MRKIPKRFSGHLITVLLGFFMSFLMSGVVTYLSVGIIDHFLLLWLANWGKSFVIALPILFVVRPIVMKLAERLTE
jgi:hypothetical protein